jgi:hypothetical protein
MRPLKSMLGVRMNSLVLKKSLFNRFVIYMVMVLSILTLYSKIGIWNNRIVYLTLTISFILLFTLVYIDSRKPIIEINNKFIKFNNEGFYKKTKLIELEQVSKMKWYQRKKKGQITGGMILEIQLKDGGRLCQNLDLISKMQRKRMFAYLNGLGIIVEQKRPVGDIELF